MTWLLFAVGAAVGIPAAVFFSNPIARSLLFKGVARAYTEKMYESGVQLLHNPSLVKLTSLSKGRDYAVVLKMNGDVVTELATVGPDGVVAIEGSPDEIQKLLENNPAWMA